ncbi:uncharacterized protein K02A2.6-like [Amphibalanus amphitrite]|uniref:uncharacterized protein K02A2.6-like n=1 Tax=Amphibalanus amphitrite TaxID=1232801 RepID=UPI001C918DFF|nr:uncharacterized protein K02A2.6-like [Amphibalanus amphitrite]
MATSLPPPPGMQKGEDFGKWIKSVEIYMGAQNIESSAQKVNIVLHLLGPDVQEIVDTLPDIADVTDPYVKLRAQLEKHFKPQVNTVVERHVFNMMQYEGGRVEEYVAKLKTQARKCNFEASEMDNLIRDKLLATCPSSKVKESMLKERVLTLSRAIMIWSTDATVNEQVRRMGKSAEEEAVNKVKWQNKERNESLKERRKPWNVNERKSHEDKRPWKNANGQGKTWKNENTERRHCFRCGKTNHLIKFCRVPPHVRCHNCGKQGHLKAACRNGKTLNVEKEDQDDEVEENLCVYQSTSKGKEAIKVNMAVNEKNVTFIVDTGCPVTMIPEAQAEGLNLKNTRCKLTSYTGHEIPVRGMTEVDVQYEGQMKKLPVYVVGGNGPCLLGRNWLHEIKLNWSSLVGQVKEKPEPQKKMKKLSEVLKEHEELFSDELGTMSGQEADLELKKDAEPVFKPARSVPYSLTDAVEKELERWKTLGVIEDLRDDEPTPKWATPLVVVPKPDGSVRLCGDFKVTLNQYLNVPVHPLPKTEDLLATIGPAKFISVVDLSQAYLQMKLSKESQELCYLNTPFGLKRMLRLPYGVASAPMLFQRAMDRILKKVPGVKCLLDDILITGKTEEEALKRLDEVLQILKTNGLRLKKEKCQFMAKEVRYLGVRLGANGIRPDPERVKPVLEANAPTNQRELREFLGAVTFYSKFLENLSKMAKPLNELLKKDKEWKWSKECEESFTRIKARLASAEVLRHFDVKEQVTVITDASPHGLGAVLVQGVPERPVLYVLRSLSEHEKKYSQIEKEGLCIVWAFERLKQFLYGRHFKLVTDNKPLAQVIGPKTPLPTLAASRIQRWTMKMAEYDFTVEVRRSEQIPVADWLSRLPKGTSVMNSSAPEDECTVCLIGQLSSLNPVTAAAIQRETTRDPLLAKVVNFVNKGWPDKVGEALHAFKVRQTELTVEQGCLMWGCRVVVPPNLRERVLEELHEGHQGMVRMKQLARMHVWWPNMDKEVEAEVRRCQGCWQKRAEPPCTDLHPWEFAKGPWQRIHLDFAGPVDGKLYVVLIDSFSKWMEIAPMKHITSEKTIEYLLNVFARFGLPHQIVTDNGPQLVSKEFEGFLKRNGIRHVRTAPFKPATNGAAERAVGCLKGYLKATSGKKMNLPNFLMAYRNTPQATTGRTPSELMLGRQLRTRLDLLKPDLTSQIQNKQQTQVERRHGQPRQVAIGDAVLARDYRGRGKWAEGEVMDVVGTKHYLVQVHDQVWKRHINQLLKIPMASPRHLRPAMQEDDDEGIRREIVVPETARPESLSAEQEPLSSPPEAQQEPAREPTPVREGAAAEQAADSPRRPAPLSTRQPAPEPEVVLRRSTRTRVPVKRLNL